MYLLNPFHSAKKSYEDVHHFWDQNSPFVLNKFILVQTIITFIFLWPFSLCKIKKKITVDPELCLCTIFGPKVVHLPQIRIFFRKPNNESCLFFLFLFFFENYYYHSHLPINPFLCAKFKKTSSSRSRVMEDVQFMSPQWPIHFPKWESFQKTC